MSFDFQLAQLRHLYTHLANGTIGNEKEAADGLLSPAIKFFEKMQATLTQWEVGSAEMHKEMEDRLAENQRLRLVLDKLDHLAIHQLHENEELDSLKTHTQVLAQKFGMDGTPAQVLEKLPMVIDKILDELGWKMEVEEVPDEETKS